MNRKWIEMKGNDGRWGKQKEVKSNEKKCKELTENRTKCAEIELKLVGGKENGMKGRKRNWMELKRNAMKSNEIKGNEMKRNEMIMKWMEMRKIEVNEKWWKEMDENEGMKIKEKMIGNECNDRKW